MNTGIDKREVIVYPLEPRPIDLPLDETYAVRADLMNANLRAIAEAIGGYFFTGEHDYCSEGSDHYGASDTTHCRLTLPTDYTEIGDVVFIGETIASADSRVWRCEIAYEDQVEITDTQMVRGAASQNNYNTIKSDLWFLVVAKSKIPITISKNEICLGSFADGLHADDIQLENGDSTTIKDKLDLIDVEHESDGTHSAGIIGNDELDKDDVLKTMGFANRVRNGAFCINNAVSYDHWEAVGGATLAAVANSCGTFPNCYCKIDTAGLNAGIKQALEKAWFQPDIPVRLKFYARAHTGTAKIKAVLNTLTISAETDELTLTTDWTTYALTSTPDSACSFELQFLATVADSQSFYISMVTLGYGDIESMPERASADVLYDAVHKVGFFVSDLTAANQIAAWTLERDLTILSVYAYAITAVTTDTIIRLTDGVTNYDVTIGAGNHNGSATANQDYDLASDMVLSIAQADTGAGADCNIVIQFRQR